MVAACEADGSISKYQKMVIRATFDSWWQTVQATCEGKTSCILAELDESPYDAASFCLINPCGTRDCELALCRTQHDLSQQASGDCSIPEQAGVDAAVNAYYAQCNPSGQHCPGFEVKK
jgi:hypothetical protein